MESDTTLFLKNGIELKIPFEYLDTVMALNQDLIESRKLPSLEPRRKSANTFKSLEPDYYKDISPLGVTAIGAFGEILLQDCWSTIQRWQALGHSFEVCSALKYLWRLGRKGDSKDIAKDLNKTLTYLNYELDKKLETGWRLRLGNVVRECEILLEQQVVASPLPNYWDDLSSLRQNLTTKLRNSPIYDPLNDGISKLQLLDIMGEDLSVVNDAKASFKRSLSEFSPQAGKLLDYLYNSKPRHSSPLRGCVLKFRVTAPIATARQW